MSNYQVLNFRDLRGRSPELVELEKKASPVDGEIIGSSGFTDEQLLRNSYLLHPKRLFTMVKDAEGTPKLETLNGVIFPASELASIINNKETTISSVYIEFCHHGFLSSKDEFSVMITGLDINDYRVRSENGQSRIYEFAQSCPTRCPK